MIDVKDFYAKYRDLYATAVTADVVAGATPAPDWMILRVIPKPAEHKMAGGLVMTNAATKTATPLVFEVLSVGRNVADYAPGDLVLCSFLAQDKLSAEICLCNQEDIILKYGAGLLLPQK